MFKVNVFSAKNWLSRVVCTVFPVLGLLPCLWSGQALAIGLGDLVVTSGLNERLVGEIQLRTSSADDLSKLDVRIASMEEHTASGIEYSEDTLAIRITLVTSGVGAPKLKLSSSDFLHEPVLNFLVDLNTRTTRVIREYVALLDPPNYQTAVTSEQPEPVKVTAAAQEVTAAPSPVDEGTAGVVLPGDTVSILGFKYRPDTSVTGAQMAWAIYEANPNAFLAGSIHQLIAGVRLRIPSKVDALRTSYQTALERVHGTAAAVATTPPASPTPAPATPVTLPTSSDASKDSNTEQPETISTVEQPQFELRLLSADDADGATDLDVLVTPESTSLDEQLKQLVGLLRKELAASHAETAQVSTQLATMHETIQMLQTELSTRDVELVDLQRKVAELGTREPMQLTLPAALIWLESSTLRRLIAEIILLILTVTLFAVMLSRRSKPQATRQTEESLFV